MAKIPFPITTYQFANGLPVANGKLSVRLSQEGSVADGQLGVSPVTIPLNSSGAIVSGTFWPNSEILPVGTYYVISVYTQQGQLVAGPNKVTL
jgi:hypothetical protein